MASSTIGSLLVALGLDTAQFEAGANKSKSIARGLSKDIESSFKSAKVAVEGLVAAFAIGALTEQIKQSLQYAAAIGETASTLGVTTKQLQEFRFAASQVGVSQEALEGGLQRLAISIGKSKLGSEAQTKAFDALAKASHTRLPSFVPETLATYSEDRGRDVEERHRSLAARRRRSGDVR
jgi:hypothetical protein